MSIATRIALAALAVGLLGAAPAFAQHDAAALAKQAEGPPLTARAPNAFYDPPAQRPERPGVLLRSEKIKDANLPVGVQGWRILYTTTVNDHTPATAVASVFAPIDQPRGPRPVITWEHATTGLMQKCMPSLISPPTIGIPALERVMAEGWVVVATDYSFAEKGGPSPYVIGEGEARSGLDSVRAARHLGEIELSNRTVVWGYSQGGHAALWTGIIAPSYAPDIEIAGVAAIAPAADMVAILAANPDVDRRLGPYIASAYSRFYPDVTFDAAIRPSALGAARRIAGLCSFVPVEDRTEIEALLQSFEGRSLATADNPALAARLAENTADRPIAAPLLIAQGKADTVVLPQVVDAFVDARCAAGQQLDYWTMAGIDHSGILQPGTPLDTPLLDWTRSRFAGQPPASGCSRQSL